jgi:hypothetical protein
MQTCVKILNSSLYNFKTIFTSLLHYMFRPIWSSSAVHNTTRRITHHCKTYHNTWAHTRRYTLDLNSLTEVQQFQQQFRGT